MALTPTLFNDRITARTYAYVKEFCHDSLILKNTAKPEILRESVRTFLHGTLRAYSAETSKESILISILRGAFNFKQDLLLVIHADFETRGHYDSMIEFFELEYKIFTEQWKDN